MATYVLPDNRLTDEQRDAYWLSREPDDAYQFMAFVQDHFPAVYDDVVINTARAYRLAALRSKTLTTAKDA